MPIGRRSDESSGGAQRAVARVAHDAGLDDAKPAIVASVLAVHRLHSPGPAILTGVLADGVGV